MYTLHLVFLTLHLGGAVKFLSSRILFLDGLALVAMYMLFFSPDLPKGMHLGLLGNAIVLIAAWVALYLWMRVRKVADDHRSLGEQLAGISLFFTTALGAFFFWKLSLLGWQASLDDHHTRAIGRNVVMMLIGFQIVRTIITKQHAALLGSGGEAMEDERDTAIAARASAHSLIALYILIIAVIVHLAFGPHVNATYATPINIAHWLIGTLILANVVEYGSATWQYRRATVG